MNADLKPILGISVGDPGGIGPEITAKTLALIEIYDLCSPLVVSDIRVMEDAVRITGLSLKLNSVTDPKEGKYSHGTIDVLHMDNMPASEIRYKEITPAQGRAAFEYITRNIGLAMGKKIHGTVTGPINKASINAAGYHFAGHTEIYAKYTETRDYAMMLAHGNFRVVHVSTHVSLREACDRVKKDRVLKVIRLTDAAVRKLGVEKPRVAVAGLNPHSGEEGMFGREEDEQIRPAIVEAESEGIVVEGPIPPDTIFPKMRGGMYDAAVVMYHDQGHIPTKLLGFQYDEKTGTWGDVSGVNVTLGLPIVRTSVDHGTAFGKAGEGRANPQSMIEAIRMAALLSR